MGFIQSSFPFIVWSAFIPLALLFLRIILAIMFIDSGRRHVADPRSRGEELGLPTSVAFILGAVEVIGGILILLGLWTHIAALFLSGAMLGAIYFKIFVWHTGIYGKNNDGWYYDALLLAGVGILFAVGAGSLSLEALF